MDMILSSRVAFHMPIRPVNALELRTPKWMFSWEFSQNFHCNYYFEMLIDVCSKNSNNLFSRTAMDASGWMKKDHREMSNCSKVILVRNK